MSKRSTRSFDPGTSVWWLLLPVIGAIVGAAIPYLSALGGVWSVLGSLLGAVVGVVADFTPPVRNWISARALNKWIAEVSGDSGPIGRADLKSLRIHRSDRDVDEYVRRDAHEQLHALLKERTPVLVEGLSMAGKTRLVVEVLREAWPDARVLFPKGEEDVEKLLKTRQRPIRGAIIFLDELERFLGKEEFTLGVLNTWIDDSCVVVATTTRMNYTRWRTELDSKFPGWEIVNRFHSLPLEADLSDDELESVRNTKYAKDLPSIEQLGLGRVLGRAEDIRRRFMSALDSHKGRAGLVKAAVDWSRVGLGSANKEALLTLAKAYDEDLWEDPDWEAEWSWVIDETTTDAPLVLRTGKDSWETLDLIVEEADWPLTNTTLTTMATCPHTARQAVMLVFEMHSKNLLAEDRATESLMQETADLLDNLISANPTYTFTIGVYAYFLAHIRQDHDQAEKLYKQALTINSKDAINLGAYAVFLTYIRHDYDRAEKLYTQALAINPNNATNLDAYALFLTYIRHDYSQAEKYYKHTIKAHPNNAFALGAYAYLLENVHRDYDQAEKHYKQAIRANPDDATNLGNYAHFLENIHRDYDQAEKYYEQAIKANPNNPRVLGNYSRLLFVTGRDEKGVELAERALKLVERGQEALCAECHFCLFMHSPRHRIASGRALKALLADGVTTYHWSFEGNLERLRQEEDPRYELAQAVAEALRTGDTSALNDFEEWRDLDLPDREE
ncbi:tetratricopeptide repeat protein [Arachnia propionica]|uniref:tetratricopeptide repeat protein n=1 Tax=Arachnia propionica TaxID=1750 RepID=UPI0028E30052|nr:tetratricopeptide repeat protein [Arachnia propionica]